MALSRFMMHGCMTRKTKQERRAAKRRRRTKATRPQPRGEGSIVKEFTLYCDEAGNSGENGFKDAVHGWAEHITDWGRMEAVTPQTGIRLHS